eukprot:Awhi_evm1s11015
MKNVCLFVLANLATVQIVLGLALTKDFKDLTEEIEIEGKKIIESTEFDWASATFEKSQQEQSNNKQQQQQRPKPKILEKETITGSQVSESCLLGHNKNLCKFVTIETLGLYEHSKKYHVHHNSVDDSIVREFKAEAEEFSTAQNWLKEEAERFEDDLVREKLYKAILQSLVHIKVKLTHHDSLEAAEKVPHSALAVYIESYNVTGWDQIWVQTSDKVDTQSAMYGAGYLEAYLTHASMFNMFINMRSDWFQGEAIPNGLLLWVLDNIEFMHSFVKRSTELNAADERLFWGSVGLIMDQLAGLYHGYKDYTPKNRKLSPAEIYMLSADGDLETLVPFSSPGFLWSLDDFYLTSSGLYVMETSNGNYNNTLKQDDIVPESVPSFIRGLAANLLANTPQQWTEVFSMYNSGTYDCQWMILDLKRFTPGQDLPTGSFHVLEQLPGLVISDDLTHVLNEQGYWASYNIPYFPDIYVTSGWETKYQTTKSEEWTHDHCPRANIFREIHHEITDLESFKHVMRYNNYKEDPLSLGKPGNAIAGRKDLDPGAGFELDGAIDAKATNVALGLALEFEAICGPAAESGLPVFVWKPEYNLTAHLGMPTVFNFSWVHSSSQPPSY